MVNIFVGRGQQLSLNLFIAFRYHRSRTEKLVLAYGCSCRQHLKNKRVDTYALQRCHVIQFQNFIFGRPTRGFNKRKRKSKELVQRRVNLILQRNLTVTGQLSFKTFPIVRNVLLSLLKEWSFYDLMSVHKMFMYIYTKRRHHTK